MTASNLTIGGGWVYITLPQTIRGIIMLQHSRLTACVIFLLTFFGGTVMSAADYVVIRKEVVVNRPAAEVWKRVGGYCAIAEWLKVSCELVSGSGEVGSVRRINGTTVEPMVSKTDLSYTYWQTAGNMAPVGYHGMLEVQTRSDGKSTLVYTLFYDQAAMPSDAVRASEHERLSNRFGEALVTMKTLAEAK